MAEERGRHVSMLYDLAREVGLEASEHPAAERLFEYQEGLLTGNEETEVQDHLTLCPDCTRMVLELSGTVVPEMPEAGVLPEERIRELWSGIRQRLLPPLQRQVSFQRRAFERVALPLAATLLLATLGASFWAWSLLRENHRLTEPRVNVVVRDLAPLNSEGINRDGGEEAGVPRETEAVLLVLNLADLRPFQVYRAEILETSDGKVLWASDELRRSSRGNFTLQLPHPFPGSGRYHIRLFGIDGGKREPLAEYEVNLSPAK